MPPGPEALKPDANLIHLVPVEPEPFEYPFFFIACHFAPRPATLWVTGTARQDTRLGVTFELLAGVIPDLETG